MRAVDVADLAAGQWGLLTTAQARAAGVSPQTMSKLARSGVLERMAHGVYRLAGAPYDVRDELRAAWLSLDPDRTADERLSSPAAPSAPTAPDAVVSFRSAAKYHELGDLDADRHEFTVDDRRQSRRADIRLHRGTLAPDQWQVINGLPVTTILKTVEDLARARTDGGHLAGVVRDAITVAMVEVDQVSEALRPYAHKYGAQVGDGRGLVARFIDEAGLPVATQQAADLTRPNDPDEQDAASTLQQAIATALPTLAYGELLQQQLQDLNHSPAVQELQNRIMSDPEWRRAVAAAVRAARQPEPYVDDAHKNVRRLR
jgi:predicted transcriptional regulator of viral defense system